MDFALTLSILRSKSLGAPAAERDEELLRSFVYSDVYRDFETGKASIVIGSRGAGKSAIFRKLAADRRAANDCVVEISPEHYSYEILSESLQKEASGNWRKQSAFSVAWQYALYVTAIKSVCDAARQRGRKVDPQLSAFLAEKYKGEQHDPKSSLLSYLKRMESLKIGPWTLGVQTRELDALYKLEELHKLLPALKDELQRQRVYIMVDELDRGWDGSEDAKFFVSGLFQASIEINKLSQNLRVLISLRRELYDNIPAIYEDAQKVRDLIRNVRWDERSLRQLIEKRFSAVLNGYESPLNDGWWYAIFEEGLSYRKTDSFKYIVDRTTYRPREIMQFCSECIMAHVEGASKIDYKSISAAERTYSRDRIDDIVQEFRFSYPGLREIFETFRGKVYSFSKDELEAHCVNVVLGAGKLGQAAQWLESQDETYLIRVLWETGFLRAYVVGNQKGTEASGSTHVGYHQIADLTLENVARFQVHPMFRTHLGMKEKS